ATSRSSQPASWGRERRHVRRERPVFQQRHRPQHMASVGVDGWQRSGPGQLTGGGAMVTKRQAGWAMGFLTALALMVGCSQGPATGEVTGTVTVDGQMAPAGSSITFI